MLKNFQEEKENANYKYFNFKIFYLIFDNYKF